VVPVDPDPDPHHWSEVQNILSSTVGNKIRMFISVRIHIAAVRESSYGVNNFAAPSILFRKVSQWFFCSLLILPHSSTNAKVLTVLGSIPKSSDTVESEGRQMNEAILNEVYLEKLFTTPGQAQSLVWRSSIGLELRNIYVAGGAKRIREGVPAP
jgi:hypothetical protein